jgi:7-cyano-7-deazaguanine reductase
MSQQHESTAENSQLGQSVQIDAQYNPDRLFPILRQEKRDEIGVPDPLPFFGFDLWHHYEVSWLNHKGKPVVAMAEICYDCHTPSIIESKSMKLYFNSFNNTSFPDVETLRATIEKDISSKVGGTVSVNITPLTTIQNTSYHAHFEGICLDELDIDCNEYMVNRSFLHTESDVVDEVLHSNLLKSNCLVTNQPDWGSVQIAYKGKKINHIGLLRYIVSFRNHNEFHEQCIERIFMDILRECQPEELTVYGRYTRRGGLDINPFRSTKKINQSIKNNRLCRQ